MIHDRTRYVFTMNLSATAVSVAEGWIGVLSYLVLERVGWRIFILITSLPFFFPQLILLQFFLPDSKRYVSELATLEEVEFESDGALVKENDDKRNGNVYAFIFETSAAHGVQCLIGYGAIILMPAYTKAHNLVDSMESTTLVVDSMDPNSWFSL